MNIFEVYEKIEVIYSIKEKEADEFHAEIIQLTKKVDELQSLISEVQKIQKQIAELIPKRDKIRNELGIVQKALEKLDIWEIIKDLGNRHVYKEQAKAHWNQLVWQDKLPPEVDNYIKAVFPDVVKDKN
jgi:hypothetical protein